MVAQVLYFEKIRLRNAMNGGHNQFCFCAINGQFPQQTSSSVGSHLSLRQLCTGEKREPRAETINNLKPIGGKANLLILVSKEKALPGHYYCKRVEIVAFPLFLHFFVEIRVLGLLSWDNPMTLSSSKNCVQGCYAKVSEFLEVINITHETDNFGVHSEHHDTIWNKLNNTFKGDCMNNWDKLRVLLQHLC
ncbi:hypothetical protein GOBAR_DD06768 [Gossypium barbadense]|nr:hypothetical protein GOBAR_DD06768 [Gossypium barbadense]